MLGKLPSFDVLKDLAENNPEELEALRKELSDEVINAASENVQRRLRGLQFQIDVKRKQAKTPMAACIAISNMMHESLGELRNALNAACNNNTEIDLIPATRNAEPAQIIEFNRR